MNAHTPSAHDTGWHSWLTPHIIAIWVAFAAMIVVNGLAQTRLIGGVTTAEVSDSVPSWFTPAGYVFSIWGVIYLLTLVWMVRLTRTLHAANTPAPARARAILFVLTCILNAIWLIVWQLQWFAASIVVILIMALAVWTLQRMSLRQSDSAWDWAPLSVYGAWLVVASVANISFVLTRSLGDRFVQPWPAVLTVAASAIVLLVAIWMRYAQHDWAFCLVALWATIGIGVKLMPTSTVTAVTIIALAVVAGLVTYVPWGWTAPRLQHVVGADAEQRAARARREMVISRYFAMWVNRDFHDMDELFNPECRYEECTGAVYQNRDEMHRWVRAMLERQQVSAWDIDEYWHVDDNRTVMVSWTFAAQEATSYIFDGISVIHFDDEGRIEAVREFKSEHERRYDTV